MNLIGKVGVKGCLNGCPRFRVDNGAFSLCL
jgi:hypothetical protein